MIPLRDSQNDTDLGDKSFSCGHPVWGLAFGPRPPKSAAGARPTRTPPKGSSSLLLATGLENGVIKIWNVLTGETSASLVSTLNSLSTPTDVLFWLQARPCSISTAMKVS